MQRPRQPKLTAEKLSPAVETPDSTETTVSELESSALKTLGVNAFYTNSYNAGTDTTERRAVLTRFVSTGAVDMVLAMRNEPADLGEGLLFTGGTYYYKPLSAGLEYFDSVTVVNNTDQTIWGVAIETQWNMTFPTFRRYYSSSKFFSKAYGFPLNPGESTTFRSSTYWGTENRDCVVKYITGYTTVDPVKYFSMDEDEWVKLPIESYELVRLVKVSAPGN